MASEQGNLRELFDKVVIERNLMLVKLKETEQQLAQAREEVEFLHIVNGDIKEQNAAMRALLERFTRTVPERHGEPECIYCHNGLDEDGALTHKDTCLWLRARAFLAAHPA